MTERDFCNSVRLFGVRWNTRLVPWRYENSGLNVFRSICNADNKTILKGLKCGLCFVCGVYLFDFIELWNLLQQYAGYSDGVECVSTLQWKLLKNS